MKNETALATLRPATPGQINEIYSLLPKGVPTDLTFEAATAIIGSKGAFIQKIAALFPDPAVLTDQVKQWEHFYREVFGITADFSRVPLPEGREGFSRLLAAAEGLSQNQVYDACAKRFSCWRCSNDLDASVTENDRDPNRDGTYAVWVRNVVEADEGLKSLSASALKEQKIKGVTLMERMLLELKYFLETGNHLDIQKVTLCSGSRYSDGYVPGARWNDGEFGVSWYYPDYAYSYLRSREVVSL